MTLKLASLLGALSSRCPTGRVLGLPGPASKNSGTAAVLYSVLMDKLELRPDRLERGGLTVCRTGTAPYPVGEAG